MNYDSRIKLSNFDGETIYKNDYRKFIPDKREYNTWPKDRSEPPTQQRAIYNAKDIETLIKFRPTVDVPFNLFIKPRPIIDISPNSIVPQLEKPIDKDKEEAMRTRPRLYVSPAVSFDDIPDPEMRKLLCDYTYTTDWKKASKETALSVTERTVSTKTLEYGRDPVLLYTNLYTPLPLGWRERGRPWDNKQMRGFVDPTTTFWMNKSPEVKCGACTNPYRGAVSQETKDEISNLIAKNEIRMAHDYLVPGYSGHQPHELVGIPLMKSNLKVTHPFLSTAQAAAQRFTEDKYK